MFNFYKIRYLFPHWHLNFLPIWHRDGLLLPNELLFSRPFLFFYSLPDGDLLTFPQLFLLLHPNLFLYWFPDLKPLFLPFKLFLLSPNLNKPNFYKLLQKIYEFFLTLLFLSTPNFLPVWFPDHLFPPQVMRSVFPAIMVFA